MTDYFLVNSYDIFLDISKKNEEIKKIIIEETPSLTEEERKKLFKTKGNEKTIQVIKARQAPLEKEKKSLDQKIQAINHQIENFETPLFLPKFFKAIAGKPASEKEFILAADAKAKGLKYKFLKILYVALKKDGTFGGKHDENYPKHIALHALLGYLWKIANTKEQIITVMHQAGLFKSATLSKHRLESAISLHDLALANYETGEYVEVGNKRFPKEYWRLKGNIEEGEKIPFEDVAYAGYGYEIYERRFPENVGMGNAGGNKDRMGDKGPLKNYPDCGETALRNFFNIMFSKEGGSFDVGLIPTGWAYHEKLLDFYTHFPNISVQKGQAATDAWSSIVSDLNKKDNPELNTDVQYVGRHTPGKKFSEINSGPWGMGNILNVMGKLTGDEELQVPWTYKNVPIDFHNLTAEATQAFHEQIASKLTHLCTLLSRKGFKVNWSKEGQRKISSVHGHFKFHVENESFIFNISPGHFQIDSPPQQTKDWRKGKNFSDELLQPFYSKNPLNSLLNPKISEKSVEDIISFWKNKTELSQITFPLRWGYKLYGVYVEDENAQKMIMDLVNKLLQPSEKNHPLVEDFVHSLLVDKYRNTQLFYAVYKGHLEIVKLLLEKGANVNAKDKYGDTPLLRATKQRHLEIVKLLLDKGADVNEKDKYGDTPLLSAVEIDHLEIVKLLLEKGANVNAKNMNGYTPLMRATENGHLEMVKLLLDRGANVNEKNKNNYETSLHWAVWRRWGGDLEIAKLLLEKGANVNAKDMNGYTPLLRATEQGDLEIMRLLLYKGADVNEKNKSEETPLHAAAKSGKIGIIKLLLQYNADITIVNENIKTPLDLIKDIAAQLKIKDTAGELPKVNELISLMQRYEAKRKAATQQSKTLGGTKG